MLARARGFAAVADGSNADDRGDYRPGRRAAREFGVISPLDEAGLSKDDIRALSHEAGLPTWDEPASACLSSRIPYFSEVTDEKLRDDRTRRRGRPRARASASCASVTTARSRASSSAPRRWRARSIRRLPPRSTQALRALGFRFVALDLKGYRLGSLNEGVRLRPV